MRRLEVLSRGKNWDEGQNTFGLRDAWLKLCSLLAVMGELLLKVRFFRRFWQLCERIPGHAAAAFSSDGLGSHEGRLLIMGKFRRLFLSSIPPLARYMQKKYKMVGGCATCGASCKLLAKCPHFDDETNRCTVYEDRPNICRMFPITPADIRDRDIVSKKHPCGFKFGSKSDRA